MPINQLSASNQLPTLQQQLQNLYNSAAGIQSNLGSLQQKGYGNTQISQLPQNVQISQLPPVSQTPTQGMAVPSIPPAGTAYQQGGQYYNQQNQPLGQVYQAPTQTQNTNPNAPYYSGGQSQIPPWLQNMMNPQETPEQAQSRQQMQSTLDRLTGLYDELSKANQPSADLTALQTQITQQQKALNDLTPQKYLETQPGLKGLGVNEAYLERSVAAARDPIANALSNLLASESVLSQDQARKQQALQNQASLLQTQFGLQKELQGLQPKPTQLPEATQSAILNQYLGLNKPTTPTSVQEYQFAQQNPGFQSFLKGSTTAPTSIQEYQYAQQQGYKGTYLDFQKEQANLKSPTIALSQNPDRLLTLQEQQAYGLPAGSTLAEATGLSPLSQTTRSTLNSIQSALPLVNQLGSLIDGLNLATTTPMATVRGILLSTESLLPSTKAGQFNSQRNAFVSLIVRALGEKGTLATSDVERIKAALPGFYDTKESAKNKLDNLQTIMTSVYNKAKSGYYEQAIAPTASSAKSAQDILNKYGVK